MQSTDILVPSCSKLVPLNLCHQAQVITRANLPNQTSPIKSTQARHQVDSNSNSNFYTSPLA